MDWTTLGGLGEAAGDAAAEPTAAELEVLCNWVYEEGPAAVLATGLVLVEDVQFVVDKIIDDLLASPGRMAAALTAKQGLARVAYVAVRRWSRDNARRATADDERAMLYVAERYQPREERSPTEDRVELGELIDILNRAVQRMPPLRRQVFRLIRGKEHPSHAEAAKQIGVSEDAVKLHMCRALRNLREVVDEWRDEHHA